MNHESALRLAERIVVKIAVLEKTHRDMGDPYTAHVLKQVGDAIMDAANEIQQESQ